MKKSKNSDETQVITIDIIESTIFRIRGKKLMIDRNLTQLYGVKTKVLNQAVTRNIKRFPDDFMFRVSKTEKDGLVTNCDRFTSLKHSSVMPRAFTQKGVAMLSTVLHSERAIQVNIQIMRAFIKFRQMLVSHEELCRIVEKMEQKYDAQFQAAFQAIKQLLKPPKKTKRKIGF